MVQRLQGTIIEVAMLCRAEHGWCSPRKGIKVSMPNVAVLTFNEQGKVTSAHVYLDMKNIESQLVR